VRTNKIASLTHIRWTAWRPFYMRPPSEARYKMPFRSLRSTKSMSSALEPQLQKRQASDLENLS